MNDNERPPANPTEPERALIIEAPPRPDRRRGRFRLSFDFLDSFSDVLADVMPRLWVLDLTANFADRTVTYVAESDAFEPVNYACRAPDYVARFFIEEESLTFEKFEKVRVDETLPEVEQVDFHEPKPKESVPAPEWFAKAHEVAVSADAAAAHREALEKAAGAIGEGFGGVTPTGTVVDRREVPDAIPIPANTLLGTPAPKPVIGPPESTGNAARDAMRDRRGIASNG